MIGEWKGRSIPDIMKNVGVSVRSGKRAVAADVWRLMLECSMAQFGQASGILQQIGLTPGHMKLLMNLEEGDGRAMGSLAQSFRCDASTMTWLVDRLEERGLVERRKLASDRRVKAVALTPLGAKTKAELTQRLYQPPEALLTLDRGALQGLLGALEKIRTSTPGAQADRAQSRVESA
jgi:DNA-binding MarR family transcriptional regulator